MQRGLLALALLAATGIACASETAPSSAASRLGFLSQPDTAEGRVAFDPAVRVMLQDVHSRAVTDAEVDVTIRVSVNPGAATLSGTTTVRTVNGIATFPDLSLELPGDGYVLEARSAGLPPVASAGFTVRWSFVEVSAGLFYSCGLTIAGFAYCWGQHGQGQLGDGTALSNRIKPTPVAGEWHFLQMDAGGFHTCGIATGGAAYCWGYNVGGELGDGTFTTRKGPTPVGGALTLAQVSTAGFVHFAHTCGITPGNVAYCWGSSSGGVIGDGDPSDTPRLAPTAVAGNLRFSQVSAGANHTCGVTTSGSAYCWGANFRGQLGIGTTDNQYSPALVLGGLSFVQVSAGSEHSCGITTGNTAYCWGGNSQGQVGDGTTDERRIPAAVEGGLAFLQLSPGAAHTCGVATNRQAYCWGSNDWGQLGDGTTTPRFTPTLVAGGLSFARVNGGWSHTCGVTADHVAYCWGFNGSGELGDDTTIDHLTPRRVFQ